MHQSTALAVATAQDRRDRTTSGHKQDLYDLALDELLRQPDRDGDPEHLLGTALANARKRQRRRANIATITPCGNTHDLSVAVETARRPRPGPGSKPTSITLVTSAASLTEALDWLRSAPLTKAERLTLETAAIGEFVPSHGATTPSARQRLARARGSARAARLGVAW